MCISHTEECIIIETSSTEKAKLSSSEDLSNFQHIVANSMMHLNNNNNGAMSPQQQQSLTVETQDKSPFREPEEEGKEGNETEETRNQVGVLVSEGEIKDKEKDMHTENQKESDHQYFTEEMETQQAEEDDDDDDDDNDEVLWSEIKREEIYKEVKSEEEGERETTSSVITATQGSHGREDYVSHKLTLPESYSSSKAATASPVLIQVQPEESERDVDMEGNDDDGDDDSLSQRSTVADESEMFDIMRGNLGLLEQAIALKAQQVKAHRELSRIPEHHRFFPLDDRSGKHMEHIRKSCFVKGQIFDIFLPTTISFLSRVFLKLICDNRIRP